MSKKSYKRNQNRLYREIKKRILAEQTQRISVIEVSRNIETLAIKHVIPNNLIRENEFANNLIEFIKTNMADKLTKKLVAEGFVEFFSRESPKTDSTEMEARIYVVKPSQKGR